MKRLLYLLSTGQSAQWQDPEETPYGEMSPVFGLFDLDPNNIPPEFQNGAMAFGYWVIDGALTTIAPPPLLPVLAEIRSSAVRATREALIAQGVPMVNGTFAPTDAQLPRLSSVAMDYAAFGITSVDVEMGSPPVWVNIAGADLAAAYAAFAAKREACYTNERAHLEAIQLLLDQEDRPSLNSYDTSTGWPA